MELSGGPFLVLFLIVAGLIGFVFLRGSGWAALASRFPERVPFAGELHRCPTIVMIGSMRARLVGGIVRVGASSHALYIVGPRLTRWVLPTIELPWSAIASAKIFEAGGWVRPVAPGDGATLRAEYDPGFTGTFIEIETREPKISIQLPAEAIDESRRYLPLA